MLKQHSFGGSALDRHVFDLETAFDISDDDLGGSADDQPVPEPEPVEPEPEPEAPAAWAGPSQDEWQRVLQASQQAAETNQYIAQLLAQANQPALAELPEFEMLSEGDVQNLLGLFGQALDQRLGPIQSVVAESQGEKMQAQVEAWIGEDTGKLKLDLADDEKQPFNELVAAVAVQLREQAGADMYGNPRVDGRSAVSYATQTLGGMIAKAREQGKQAYLDEIKAIEERDKQRREPGGSGGGALEIVPTARDEVAAALSFVERNRR